MTMMGDGIRRSWARALLALFATAILMASAAASADAAPMSKCRNDPENYGRYHGKCLSDKRIEVLKERASGVEDNGVDANDSPDDHGADLDDDHGNDASDDHGNDDNAADVNDDNGVDANDGPDDNGADVNDGPDDHGTDA